MSGKYRLACTALIMGFLFSGCSSKQYFQPKETYSVSGSSFRSTIVDLSRNGATLKNTKYIGEYGVSTIKLGADFRFLNENDKYILASNPEGILNIIDKGTHESIRAVMLHVPIVSASIHNGLIAYILNNNTFGLYDMAENKKLIQNRSQRSFAIDTKAANPMFVDNLVIMPMLDGKLVIVDTQNSDNTKVVYLSSNQFFNNVTYLARMGDTMVAATSTRIITLGENGKQKYDADISEVAINNTNIYLFTKKGVVIKLNSALKEIGRKKFKFAHYATGTAFGDKVFALDQKGSLIVLSSDLNRYKVYDVGSVEHGVFISGSRLYKGKKVFNLSQLDYK